MNRQLRPRRSTQDGHLPICSEPRPSRDVVRMANLLLAGPVVLRGRRVDNPPQVGNLPHCIGLEITR